MRRTTVFLVAAVLAMGTGLIPAIPVAASEAPSAAAHKVKVSPYVALGDSYSSAAGVHPQDRQAPPSCSRSLKNYAHVIARRADVRFFTDVTCSGADTTDLFSSQGEGIAPQLDAVTKKTRLVTMTIGGNDGGAFGRILDACVKASLGSDPAVVANPCEREYGSTFTDIIADFTYPNLVKALSAVRQQAPRATVAILGYPRVMPETFVPSCYPVMPISAGDISYVTDFQQALNGAVQKAAAETGVTYIDMSEPSAGHDVCQPPEQRWIEPLFGPQNADPVHPNIAGELAMAEQTMKQLGIDPRRPGGRPDEQN